MNEEIIARFQKRVAEARARLVRETEAAEVRCAAVILGAICEAFAHVPASEELPSDN